MPRLRNPLTAIFSPTRRLIGVEPSLVQRGGLLGPVETVVPRSDCHYRRHDLSRLPARQRHPAARIAARRDQLSPDAVSRIAWTGGVAHVWTWSPADPAAGADPGAAVAAWIPETLLRPVPADDGLRLVRMVRGVEGQLWRNRQLAASQWWPEVPGVDTWHRFLRASGVAPEEAPVVPAPQDVGWSVPWADVQLGSAVSPATAEKLAWRAVIGGLALALGWQLSAHAGWSAGLSQLEARTQALRTRAAPLIEARERADAARETLQAYRELQRATSDFVLMADVIKPLPEGALLSFWQREGVRLQVGVKSSESDPRVFVDAYEKHPQLANVLAAPAEPGVMRLDFTLPEPPGSEPHQ